MQKRRQEREKAKNRKRDKNVRIENDRLGFILFFFILDLDKKCNVMLYIMVTPVTRLSHISQLQLYNHIIQKRT